MPEPSPLRPFTPESTTTSRKGSPRTVVAGPDPSADEHPTKNNSTTTTLSSSRRRSWYLIVSVLSAAGVSLYQLRVALNLSRSPPRGGDHHEDRSTSPPRRGERGGENVASPWHGIRDGADRAAKPVSGAKTPKSPATAAAAAAAADDDDSKNASQSSPSRRKKWLRIDDAAPPALFAATHFLQSSIPTEMRLPPYRAQNETLLYSDPLLQKRQYVFEFNPSLVILPVSQRDVAPNAAYVACYRVSTQHACYHQERNDDIRHRNYIGFAILDAHLNVLVETTVDPSPALRRFEDFRLFVLNDELYVGSFQSLHRFWVHDPPKGGGGKRDRLGPVVVPSLTPDQPRNLTITIERNRRCSRDPEILRTAKSLTYFATPNGSIVMEPFPMADKEVIPDGPCELPNDESTPKVSIPLSTTRLPDPTFRTTDENYLTKTPGMRLPALTSDRGSYCCATLEHNGVRYLLGVSHLKTRYFNAPAPRNPTANQYFTRFYALHAEPPYDVAARTGKFCFGGHWDHMNNHPADDDERMFVPEPYVNLTSTRRLVLGNESYRCPGIHFVSGMTDDANDPANRLVIGYGVNDCFARFVVVDKSHVARMLFG